MYAVLRLSFTTLLVVVYFLTYSTEQGSLIGYKSGSAARQLMPVNYRNRTFEEFKPVMRRGFFFYDQDRLLFSVFETPRDQARVSEV